MPSSMARIHRHGRVGAYGRRESSIPAEGRRIPASVQQLISGRAVTWCTHAETAATTCFAEVVARAGAPLELTKSHWAPLSRVGRVSARFQTPRAGGIATMPTFLGPPPGCVPRGGPCSEAPRSATDDLLAQVARSARQLGRAPGDATGPGPSMRGAPWRHGSAAGSISWRQGRTQWCLHPVRRLVPLRAGGRGRGHGSCQSDSW